MAASFAHILVPLDLSRRNGKVITTAGSLAREQGARITLLHVIQRIEHIPVVELRTFYRRLEARARRTLAAAVRRLKATGTEAAAAVLTGAPAFEIVRFARTNGVDLIVMRSHRVDPRRGSSGWGTMSYKVGVLCRCPILLLK
jgi:nucleotide-binding universal stress UspA family protein